MLTICGRSVVMQSEPFWKNPAGRILRQQEEDFECSIMSCRFLSLIGSNCFMVLELVLGGHMDNTPPVPGTTALTACLIFCILVVKKRIQIHYRPC